MIGFGAHTDWNEILRSRATEREAERLRLENDIAYLEVTTPDSAYLQNLKNRLANLERGMK